MKTVSFMVCATIFLAGCGSSETINSNSNGATGGIFYEDSGFSNIVPSCSQASDRVLSSVEINMTPAQVRALVGKPRHVVADRWHFGQEIFKPIPLDWYYIPTLSFFNSLVDSFSGDYIWCVTDDGLLAEESAFIEAANNYTLMQDVTDYSDSVTNCFDAAVRIASRIEIGMTEEDARRLVGKPVEITESSVWRYSYGILPAPTISFSTDTQTVSQTRVSTVVGYSSISYVCN